MNRKSFFFLLLLCLPLLFCSCHRIEYLEMGDSYYADGVWQNARVNMVITADDWTAPLESLTYTVYNETDFKIHVLVNDLRVEVYRDGKWSSTASGESLDVYLGGFDCRPDGHESRELSSPRMQRYGGSVYRVRVPFVMRDLPDGEVYGAEVIGYFTVTPMPDAEVAQ